MAHSDIPNDTSHKRLFSYPNLNIRTDTTALYCVAASPVKFLGFANFSQNAPHDGNFLYA